MTAREMIALPKVVLYQEVGKGLCPKLLLPFLGPVMMEALHSII